MAAINGRNCLLLVWNFILRCLGGWLCMNRKG